MKNKDRYKLIQELKNTSCIKHFIAKNNKEVKKENFSEYLDRILKEKNLTKAHAIRKSGLEQSYAYHIFSGDRNPSRKKVLALAIALELDIAKTQYLLKLANVGELYIRSQWDCVILHALNKNLNVIETNQLLEELEETEFLE